MVSHAEVAENSRRVPSVSSRSGRNHHHRSRSHQGGTNYAPQNEFPFFVQTGDVEILVQCERQEKRYLLHRLMLAQFSGFFSAGTNESWSMAQAVKDVQQASEKRPEMALSVIGEEPPRSSEEATSVLTVDQMNRVVPNKRRWRYELNWADVADDEEPLLVQCQPQGSSFAPLPRPPPLSQPRPKPTSNSFFRSVANLAISSSGPAHGSQSVANLSMPPDPSLANPLLRDYDNLFRIFYNYSPILNTTNIASAYSECKALINLADMYDALQVVGPRIEHHLLAFSSRLFKQIAKYPPSYLKLGYLSRSKVIFSEALTHVVGQWPAAQSYLKPSTAPGVYEIPLHVLDLIEDKVDELEDIKSKVEAKLFRLTLTTSRGERVNPANDYLGWLAMSLFRQWIAENTTPEVRGILKNNNTNGRHSANSNNPNTQPPQSQPQPPGPVPVSVNTGRIYRLLSSPDTQTYLSHDELKRFLKLNPSPPTSSTFSSSSTVLYTRDNLRRFERRMDQLKNLARDIVKPLTRNCLELDLRALSDGQGGGLGYLTCMRVEEGEMPWD